MKRVRGAHPKKMTFGEPKFADDTDRYRIRLRTSGRERGVIFHDGTLGLMEMVLNGHLELKCHRLIMWTHDRASEKQRMTGDLFFNDAPSARLPHHVTRETRVQDRKVKTQQDLGLGYHADEYSLVAWREYEHVFRISWAIPQSDSRDNHPVAWPDALLVAWQFINGQNVSPSGSEIHDSRRRIVVVNRVEEAVSLGALRLFPANTTVTGNMLLQLTQFFASKSIQAQVAMRLLAQCFDGARADTWQAVTFLFGTALEAILRTLYRYPFQPGKRSTLPRKQCLEQLRKDYFDNDWTDYFIGLNEIFERLRHRSAHPDWLPFAGGSLSSSSKRETFEDLVSISSFYGKLILAMAGIEPDKPNVNKPA